MAFRCNFLTSAEAFPSGLGLRHDSALGQLERPSGLAAGDLAMTVLAAEPRVRWTLVPNGTSAAAVLRAEDDGLMVDGSPGRTDGTRSSVMRLLDRGGILFARS